MTEEIVVRQQVGKQRTLIVLAVLGISAYVAVALVADAAKLQDALRRLGWVGSGAVLALSILNYLLRFHRWKIYLDKLGQHLPILRHLLYYVGGFAFTVSPAKAGEAVRSFYLRDHGVSFSESIAVLFVERLLDLVAIVVLASLIVSHIPGYQLLVIGVGLVVLLLLIISGHPALPRLLNAYVEKHQGDRIAKLLSGLGGLLVSSQSLLKPQLLLLGLMFGLGAWGAEGLGFYLICQGLQLNLGPVEATGIYAVAVLAGTAAIFLPAGIGGMELVMTSLLVSRGASLPVAVVATLICRLATLWFAVLIGLAAALFLEFQCIRQRAVSIL